MRQLRHSIPLGAGETPASFVSRVAAQRRLPARELCLNFGITFQKIVDGNPEALAILAVKTGVDPAMLASNTFTKIGDRLHEFRGEHLVRGSLRRAAIAVCPKCIADDIAAAPNLRSDLAPFQRAICQIAAVKSCHVHTVPLTIAVKDLTPGKLHDWMQHIGPFIPDLQLAAATIETKPITGFENYVITRANHGPMTSDLLDVWPFHVAIATCELFGAVASFGRTPNLKKLVDDEWRIAGAAGFDILAAGKAGIEVFLEDLQASYPYARSGNEGPQAVFGRVYQTLEFGREDSAYDPVRAVVGDYIRTNFPVGPGEVVFGKPIETRRLHSIRSLSMETKLHPKRLRKLLKAAGVLPDDADHLVDGNCLFDAQKGLLSASEASVATLTVRKAGEYINAPRVQRVLLNRAGLIVPRIRAGDHGAADMFAPADLDVFMDRLLDGAVPVTAVGPGQATIPDAAKKACCGAETVVRLVLDGKLQWKGVLAGERGYMAVLVDVAKVRMLVRGADHGGLTGKDLQDRLRTTDRVIRNLIARGHLKTETVIHPVNRCPTVIVPIKEIERFEAGFVSLFVLANEQGRHFRKLKQELDAAGIVPALDPTAVGATFYRRRELDAAKILTNPKGQSR